MKRPRPSAAAWAALGAAVAAWDLAAPEGEMLTHGFRRGLATPAGKAALVVTWGVLTAHLFGVLPPRADPFHAVHVARDRVRR